MADKAHIWTDRKIKQLEKRINREYEQAIAEIEEKTADYFRRFQLKDNKWRSWVMRGERTEKEYQEWRFGQMAVGERWENLKQTLADHYHNANEIAKKIAYDTAKDVYSENYNYSTYEIEHGLSLDTSFTLYNRETVERILREDPSVLPEPGKKVSSLIAAGLDERWNKQLVQSVVIQGILQGESIPKLAKRLAESVGDKNRKSAIRNARTMMTGAQNAGRVDSYKRAQRMGIDLQQEWVATLDGRTRHEHRLLDGQRVNVGEPFHVDGMTIRFPGDPTAPARLVYNCRCTLISQIKGFEIDSQRYRQDPDLGGMTYEEWKHAKQAKSNPITLPEEKAKNIAESYRNRYRYGGAHDVSMNSSKSVSYDKDATYRINVNGYDEKVNDVLSEAARRVAEEGSKNGYEYAALVDVIKGEIVDFGTSKEYDNVNSYYPFLRNHLDGKYALIHNHNKETSLSFPDIQELSSWENLDAISAVTNNGITSTVRSNGEKSNKLLWDLYSDEYWKIREYESNIETIEYTLVDLAVRDFGEGGIIRYDGRTKR